MRAAENYKRVGKSHSCLSKTRFPLSQSDDVGLALFSDKARLSPQSKGPKCRASEEMVRMAVSDLGIHPIHPSEAIRNPTHHPSNIHIYLESLCLSRAWLKRFPRQ